MPRLRPIHMMGSGLLALSLAATPCLATQVRQVNVEQLTSKAGRIVAGRCLRVDVSQDAALGRPVTNVTILVDRTLKGPSDHHLTFRMLGAGPIGAGVPSFAPGEEVILFLYPESAAGLTSPVGLGQGKFKVEHDKQGHSIAINGFGNRGLFERLSPEAHARLGPHATSHRPGSALARDSLLDIVAALASPAGPR